MSIVPSQSLQNLLCLKCKKYLSHLPIHESSHTFGSICGRCPKEDNDKINTVYENLAKSLRFPCCYDFNGCTEHLLPIQVPQHETYCYFRKYDCPNAISTNCKWKGLANELEDHFEDDHRTLVLWPEGFEVDFVSSYNENCLLNFENDLFILNRTNDPKRGGMTYSVSYIGTNVHTQDYSYKISFDCVGEKLNGFAVNKKMAVKSFIKRDCILRLLNNPKTVIVRVEIVKPEENEYSEVNTELLRELECTDCFEYMLPPIQQCITGHSICSKCKPKYSECPICKSKFSDTINITLGHLIDHIIYPCKYEGCRFTCKAKDIREHEETCIFGSFKCPLSDYENCEIEVQYLNIYDHILNNHYENLLEMDFVHMPFESMEKISDEDCYILRYNSELFKLHYLQKTGTFYWTMQLIGRQGKEITYKFEIDVKDNAGNNSRAYFRTSCGPLSDKTTAFDDKNFVISLSYEQVQTMITDNFSYRVGIISE